MVNYMVWMKLEQLNWLQTNFAKDTEDSNGQTDYFPLDSNPKRALGNLKDIFEPEIR